MNPNFEQQLDTYIHDHRQRKLIPCLSLAVIKDGATVIILTNQDSKPWDMCKDVAGLAELALA